MRESSNLTDQLYRKTMFTTGRSVAGWGYRNMNSWLMFASSGRLKCWLGVLVLSRKIQWGFGFTLNLSFYQKIWFRAERSVISSRVTFTVRSSGSVSEVSIEVTFAQKNFRFLGTPIQPPPLPLGIYKISSVSLCRECRCLPHRCWARQRLECANQPVAAMVWPAVGRGPHCNKQESFKVLGVKSQGHNPKVKIQALFEYANL